MSEPVAGDIATVWRLVGTLTNLPRWNPNIVRCRVREEHGVAVRTVVFTDWWIAERLLRRDSRRYTIDYAVTASSRPGIAGSRTRIELESLGPRRTLVRWRSWLPHGPPGQADQLRVYYHVRLGQLRAAVGAPASAATCGG